MHFEPGDLLLFYGRDLSSRVIEWATRGPSHVGIICPHVLVVPPSDGQRDEEAGFPPGVLREEHRQTLTPHPGPLPQRGEGDFRPGVSREERRETFTPHPDPLPQRGEGEYRPGVVGEERRETLAPHPGTVSLTDLQRGAGESRPSVLRKERRKMIAPHPNPLPQRGEGEHWDLCGEPEERRQLLFESTTLCDEPCLLTGRCIQGVQAHDPVERIESYHGAVARLRLARAWRLSAHEIDILHEWLLNVASEPYDLRGALVSGTRLFKWSALMPYPDLESLFCSELCAAALMRLHRMPLENPSVYNPASLVRVLRRCGTYGAPRWMKRNAECGIRSAE